MKFFIVALLALAACSHSSSGGANDGPTPIKKYVPKSCTTISVSGGRSLEYCTHASTATAPTSIVYYFHGLGGSAEELLSASWQPLLNALQAKLGAKMPYIVSVSFGPNALIVPAAADAATPSPALMEQEVFPAIEKQFFTGTPHRFAIGVSMGGFNALNITASPDSQIRAVAALCPALADLDPFDDTQVAQYLARNASVIDQSAANYAVQIARKVFGSSANWKTDNPLEDLRAGDYDHTPLFLSTGRQDQFGFFEGATAFATAATQRHALTTFAPVTGKHCAFDQAGLAAFLEAQLAR